MKSAERAVAHNRPRSAVSSSHQQPTHPPRQRQGQESALGWLLCPRRSPRPRADSDDLPWTIDERSEEKGEGRRVLVRLSDRHSRRDPLPRLPSNYTSGACWHG